VARPESQPVTVALATSSAQGGFSTGPDGPWTSTLSITVPAGSTDPAFYYRDTKAGSATLIASADGHSTATQVEAVVAGAVASLAVTPQSSSLASGATATFAAAGADAYGNAVAVSPDWSATGGTISPASGASTTFTAGSPGTATVTASVGSVTGQAIVTVTAPKLRVSSIAYGLSYGRLVVGFTVVRSADGTPVPSATVSLAVSRNGYAWASGTAVTGWSGTATVTSSTQAWSGCYATTVTNVTGSGLAWDGVTPANSYCR
jgi:hypothetical protein